MSLDIAEPQILIAYPEDPTFTWHHRVLLRRLHGSTWIVLTPDEEVQVEDLSHHAVTALSRNSPMPRDVGADCYLCAAAVAGSLDRHHESALRLAEILAPEERAVAAVVLPGVAWRVADPSLAAFGETVDAGIVSSPTTGVVRGSVGLAMLSDSIWTFVEKVADDDLVTWQADKQSGAGRDRRLGRNPVGGTFDGALPLADARRGFRPADLAAIPSWPHQGPRAINEIVPSIISLGLTFYTYHDHWVRQSGVAAESGTAHEHRSLCQILGLSTGFDRLDPTNCAGLELGARRLVMIERAVRVNPRAPSFEGLGKMTQHALDEGGGLATREFTAHMAQMAETEARILKQNRLFREELASKKKDGPGGQNQDGKKKDGKKGDGAPQG